VRFEWDAAKNRGNLRKHGISFAEACRLFESGAEYLELYDAEHSQLEERFIAIGPIERGLVVVVFTEPDEDLVRVLGARFATRRERDRYRAHIDGFL
jgi:uncharacterized DUF497 family protein